MTSDTLITAIDELGVAKAQMAELAKKEKASRISGGRAFARNAALILARVSVEQLRAASLGDLHRAAFLTPMFIARMLGETMIIAFSESFSIQCLWTRAAQSWRTRTLIAAVPGMGHNWLSWISWSDVRSISRWRGSH
jgi:hypothetical protein